MRPPTATLEAIKAYQKKVEKNKITPDTLPPCPRCHLESQYFKVHAYRERRFLIIVEAIVEAIYWLFPKKVDTVKRNISVSVFHIQPGRDIPE